MFIMARSSVKFKKKTCRLEIYEWEEFWEHESLYLEKLESPAPAAVGEFGNSNGFAL